MSSKKYIVTKQDKELLLELEKGVYDPFGKGNVKVRFSKMALNGLLFDVNFLLEIIVDCKKNDPNLIFNKLRNNIFEGKFRFHVLGKNANDRVLKSLTKYETADQAIAIAAEWYNPERPKNHSEIDFVIKFYGL